MSEAYSTKNSHSLFQRVFGVVTDQETYRYLAYLLVRFPLGIAYFTTFVTGITLGLALVPLGVGIPLLVVVLGVADHAGLVEAALLRRVLGRETTWEPIDPNNLPVWPYLKTVATDGRSYLLLVYCLATFWIGTISFVVLTLFLSTTLVYLVAPLVFWVPGVAYGVNFGSEQVVSIGPTSITASDPTVGFLTITTLPEALIGSAFGAVLGIVTLHGCRVAGLGIATMTEKLLDS